MQNTTDYIRILTAFLKNAMDISVLQYDGDEACLDSFISANMFQPGLQSALAKDFLLLVLQQMEEPKYDNTIFEISDIFGPHIYVFRFLGKTMITGPWVEQGWDEKKAAQKLARVGLSATRLLPFHLYYCKYPIIAPKTVQQLHNAAILSLLPDCFYQYKRLIPNFGVPKTIASMEEPADFLTVLEKTRLEIEWMQMVKAGRTQDALSLYQRMGRKERRTALQATSSLSTITGAIVNATILRTSLRWAALEGGVDPAVVDAISRNYAQKMYAAVNEKEMKHLIETLIIEYCEGIKSIKEKNYSPAVRTAANYIWMHLGEDLTQERLAGISAVSPGYLSRLFKKETGSTLSKYIAGQRCKKAAELLEQTTLPIQEISRYVGCLDNNYFVKVFRSFYSMTPSEYRQANWINNSAVSLSGSTFPDEASSTQPEE